MLKFKSIINNIVQGIGSRKVIPRTIDISEDRIIDKLLAENNSNTFLLRHLGQIILLSIVALSFLYILVSMILFFLFDVILFEPRVYTTTNGTTVITQPCGIEQAFFIHNSANYWTNSGIDIVEGDRITLSYSGSFYSTLRDLADASKNSEVVKYDWSSVYRVENTPRSIVNYCSFNGEKGYLGSLLYQIGDNKGIQPKISQMDFSNGKFSFRAPSSGPLQITVNDIYVSDTCMVKKMLKEEHSVFSKGQKQEIIKRLDFQEDTAFYRLVLITLVNSLDTYSIYSQIDSVVSLAQWDDAQDIWNNDTVRKKLKANPSVFDINQKQEIIKRLDFQENADSNRLILKTLVNSLDTISKSKASIYPFIDAIVSISQWNAQEIWYNDNIGELFVTVQIIRNNLNYANPINKLFAKLYRYLDNTWENNPFIFITILLFCVLAYLQFLIFYSFWESLFRKRNRTKNVSNNRRK